MKAALRSALRAARRGLPIAEHRRRSALAAHAIARLPRFKAGARIAIYLPFDRETATEPLCTAARSRGIELYAPVVIDRRHRRLRFDRLTAKTRRGTFGISVPRQTGVSIRPRWFTLIVVPLVAVDMQGRRLGMGGGFYDRALAFRKGRVCWPGPKLVGLCFDCQRIDSVVADPWDIRLDAIATESGLQFFSRSPS